MLRKGKILLSALGLGQKSIITPGQQTLKERLVVTGDGDYPRRYYDDEDVARQALKVVDEYTMTSYERMITLWQQVRYLDFAQIAGCMVECGAWQGGASGMMALAHLADGIPFRPLHLFDSFTGLPEPDARQDGGIAVEYADGKAFGNLVSIGQCVGSLEINQYLINQVIKYPQELTHYHVGWFQDTVSSVAEKIGPIALLRLDGDWYESTKICLEAFYPQMSSGGIVVIDDYGKWPGCRKAVDEFMSSLGRPLFLNHIDAAGRYFIVP
jgi:hypothetical protein